MLTLICAPAGFGKTYTLYDRIREILNSESESHIYYVVPEQESVKAERAILTHFGNRLNERLEILNFSRLANRVFREAGGITYRYVDSGGKDLLVACVLEDAGESLELFSNSADDENFISSVRRELDTMRLGGVSPDALEKLSRDVAEKDGSERLCRKLSELASLYALYDGGIKNENVDVLDDMTRLADTLDEYDFFDNTYVFVDGFYDFTYPEYRILERMIRDSRGVFVTLPLVEKDNENIFPKPAEAKRHLETICEKLSAELDIVFLNERKRKISKKLSYLSDNMITPSLSDNFHEEFDDDSIILTSCKTPFDECVCVAREIVKLVKSGVKFRDISVCAGSISEYGSMLEDVFEKYGIRYLSTTRTTLMSKPLVALIFQALDVVSSGFYLPYVKRYLENPLLPISSDDSFVLSNYITTWNINKSLWYSDGDWVMNPRGYVETVSNEERELLARINSARRKIFAPLMSLSERLKKEKVSDKVSALWSFIEELGVKNKLIDRADKLLEASDISRSRDEADVWNLTLEALDRVSAAIGERSAGLERFVKYMHIVFKDSDFGRIPSSLDEVEVGDIGFVRNENVKHLFALGFNEGAFPAIETPVGVFTENERQVLESYSDFFKNDSEERLLQNEVFHLLLAISMPSDSLRLVYHTSSCASSEDRVSLFAPMIMSHVPVTETIYDASTALPVCKTELIEWALKNLEKENFRDVLEEIRAVSAEAADEIERLASSFDFDSQELTFSAPEKVFSNKISMTQARLDTFSRCPFSYYSNYLLELRAHKKAEFRAAEMGSLVHKVLEEVLSRIASEGKSFADFDRCAVEQMAKESASEYLKVSAPEISVTSRRFKYLITRLTSFVVYVIENMREEFENSDFEPYLFEQTMNDDGEISPYTVELPNGDKLVFYGCVDRVDIYNGDDGKKYLRVVDYKTKIGGKKFDLNDVINGINLQLLVYLFAIWQKGEREGSTPAGIMYMPASRPSVTLQSVDMAENEKETRDSEMKRSGLFLLDEKILTAMEHGLEGRILPIKKNKNGTFSSTASLATLEQFGALKRYTDKTFINLALKLKRGEIGAEPLMSSTLDSCKWCDFKPFCRYEGCGRKYRRVKEPWIEIEDDK